MRAFSDYNPIAVFVYFLSVTGIAMFAGDPLLYVLSLAGALALHLLLRRDGGQARMLIWCLVLLLVSAIINPLVNHNGVTVLFVINDSPITAEAFWYGAASGAMIAGVMLWFASFSKIMTGDKLLYLLGVASPKLALILSMTLRYIPLFADQTRRVNDAQRGMGLYREDNAIDRFRASLRVFSVMVTWALENGIITADSMEARGYGAAHRTSFARWRFLVSDGVLLGASLLLAAGVIVPMAAGALDFSFYPAIRSARGSAASLAHALYALLCFVPAINEMAEEFKWKTLLSKI